MNIKAFEKAYKYFTGKDVSFISFNTMSAWADDIDDVDFIVDGYNYYAHIRHIIYYMCLPDGKIGIRKGEVHRFILN